MKALVYQGPGRKALEERPLPQLSSSTDAIVRVVKTTICGTDLHILKGDVPTCQPGRILGHEGVGVVEKVGDDVMMFQASDRVLISCITACGRCEYCRKGMYSHCTTGGWILGRARDKVFRDAEAGLQGGRDRWLPPAAITCATQPHSSRSSGQASRPPPLVVTAQARGPLVRHRAAASDVSGLAWVS
jgi:hypothetical protein